MKGEDMQKVMGSNPLDEIPSHLEGIKGLVEAYHMLFEALRLLQVQALQSPDLMRTEWGQEALEETQAVIEKYGPRQ